MQNLQEDPICLGFVIMLNPARFSLSQPIESLSQAYAEPWCFAVGRSLTQNYGRSNIPSGYLLHMV